MHTPDLLEERVTESQQQSPPTLNPPTAASVTSTNSGYSNLMIRDPPTAAVSSKDFADIMENLQNSRNVIQDPSRALAFSMYHSNETDGKAPPPPSTSSSSSSEHTDIFSASRRESQRPGTGNGGMGTGPKGTRKSSLRRASSRDGESSPAHNVVQKQLDAFADQLTVDEALTAVRLSLIIVSLTYLERILIDAHPICRPTNCRRSSYCSTFI
ncbi:hypothetical protein GBAR_LOCUS16680, partial [Geodia barretti]